MASAPRFRNKEIWLRQLRNVADGTRSRVQAVGDAEAPRLASAIRDAAPVGAHDPHPGALRDSVHDDRGRRPLSWRIVIDAKDAKGRFIFWPVEFGHLAHGKHVPPVSFAWPTFRSQFPLTRKRLAAAGRAGAADAAPLWFARYR